MNSGTSANDGGLKTAEARIGDEALGLSGEEKDTLGEIGNICMGTCATTLSTLLGKRVLITTPTVTTCRGNEYLEEYEKPVVATEVSYTEGLDGNNVFLLKKEDALLITNVLMGGEQTEEEIGDMYLSAISEVMNQMVGASSTALADILHVNINISPPTTTEFIREDQIIEDVFSKEMLVRINFRMEIEDLLASNIMQLMPYEFAKNLADSLMNGSQTSPVEASPKTKPDSGKEMKPGGMYAADLNAGACEAKESKPVKIRAAKFQSFGENGNDLPNGVPQQNIDLIIDVPLQVTVVLGKTKKSIREILDMGIGSVIVLDRLAGEMVDVLVNGKMFARGEVVVIDDNYGVRITEMIAANMRM